MRKMSVCDFVVRIILCAYVVVVCEAASNCNELQQAANGTLSSGPYSVTNGNGQAFSIYCQFYSGYGYAFVSKNTNVDVDMTSLYDDTSHVIIRHKRTDGLQYTSTMEQLSSHSSTPLLVKYNDNTGYASPQNYAMTPYIYVGFIPSSMTYEGAVQGWKCNGQEYTFVNCDANPNSYIVFLFNHDGVSYTSYVGGYNSLMFCWYDDASAVTSEEYLPDEFFTTFYEIHHGGCGGYAKSDAVEDITGATVGVKFEITCATPSDISYGTKSYTGTNVGSTVTYSCDNGLDVLTGDQTRTCTDTGGWSGDQPVCGVNGDWTSWSSWAGCTVTCDSGTWTRSRSCTNPAPLNGGSTCSGSNTETETCILSGCPVDGAWSEWTTWGTCDVTCGGGTASRTRTCSNPPASNGGTQCSGDDIETASCNTDNCPIDGGFDSWSSWTSCTVTCGGGDVSRSRSCTNPTPQNGGANCSGNFVETALCNTQDCPVDGSWSEWTSWSTCTVTCGDGNTERTRTCTNPSPSNGGANCTGVTEENTACNEGECPVDGGWNDWTPWTSCPVTCGGGIMNRSRSCTNPSPQNGGANCSGDADDTRSCNTNGCPVDGLWSEWGAWTTCTVTCGGGYTIRTRTCTDPSPSNGGADCTGSSDETASCNSQNCPINGDWEDWTSWTSCSVTCGSGSSSRSRTCTNPVPQYGGNNCTGSYDETITCSQTVCPIDGNWGSWTTSACSATCGYGAMVKTRSCDSPAPAHGGNICTGTDTETEQCLISFCIGTGIGEYVNQCGTGFFTCFNGSMTCIDEVFRCDCEHDCDDGSDEDITWAGCNPTQAAQCSAGSLLPCANLWTLHTLMILLVFLVGT